MADGSGCSLDAGCDLVIRKNISDDDDAKSHAMKMMAGTLSPSEIDERINDYKNYASFEDDEHKRLHWLGEIEGLEKFKNEEAYLNGHYPKGIDELYLEMIEWLSMIFAFQQLDESEVLLSKFSFLQQWYLGGTYMIFALLGNLTSGHRDDNSLTNLWISVSSLLGEFEELGAGELELLTTSLVGEKKIFSNRNSQALRYRNKVIAHNEQSIRLSWDEIEKEIGIVSRVWSLLTMWCSNGVMSPFRNGRMAFQGLEAICSKSQIDLLIAGRRQYINRVTTWCCQSVVDHKTVGKRSPFVEVSLQF